MLCCFLCSYLVWGINIKAPLSLVAEMYCQVGFSQSLADSEEDISDIELPVPVPESKEAGRKEKLYFSELKVRF